jgi:hypothetical protein
MITIHLGDLNQLQALESQARIYGEYQRYYVCTNPLGFYIVASNRDIVTFGGFAVYTSTPQDAGLVIESLLAEKRAQTGTPAKKTRSARSGPGISPPSRKTGTKRVQFE